MTSNLEGVAASHLMTPKFTKFGGQSFERLTVEETNKSEAEALSAIKELNVELTDLKIDVFGKVAVATYYSHFSFIVEGQRVESLARQALIFLETEDGWKIIHENVTPEKCFSE
jgi:ketosteroid isomerase-like protein